VKTGLGRDGSQKTIPDVEAQERPISDLRSQLDRAAQIIVAKDNNLEQLEKEKQKLQKGYNRVKQTMRQIGVCCGRKQFSIVRPMQEGEGS